MSSISVAGPSTALGTSTKEGASSHTQSHQDDELSPARDSDLEQVWNQQNLLSLDGGGIRGIWTLLVLKRLMKAIGDEERQQSNLAQTERHSFWPQEFPENVTQGPFKPHEQEEQDDATDEGRPTSEGLRDARKFLPCHYFDYICGSSTGSLIAIMLGRLRMTVQDCLNEYERVGHEIFGKPRLISQRNIAIVNWPKYSAKAMEKVFQEVTMRRSEKHQQLNVLFPSMPGVCKTFITTMKRTKGSGGASKTPYLIRSYDHLERNNNFTLRRAHSSALNRQGVRNPGPADSMEIWRVARAATAAPLYFTEIKFKTKSMAGATNVYFSDGGFGHINNPTNLGLQEIQSLHGSNNIGVLVSVGTARADDQPGGKSIFKRVKSFANAATDPRIVAEQLHGRDLYWRFNDEKGLDIELDDWKPNGWFTKNPGRDTLTKIENEFNHWARKRENIRQLEECARELVRRRRRRTEDRSKWEHYATGAQFRCMHDICESRPYNLRAEFEEHRRKEHPDSTPNDETHDPIITIWKYQGPEKP